MNKDWLFIGDGYICDLRTAGVLIRDDMILVQRDRDGKEYALPGGHVRIGETTADALIREYKEETGADIRCRRLLWTEECFWNWDGRDAHNISFYYLIELCENSDIPVRDEFVSHKDNDNVLIVWIPIETLKNVTVYPEFIKEEVHDLNSSSKHFITRA